MCKIILTFILIFSIMVLAFNKNHENFELLKTLDEIENTVKSIIWIPRYLMEYKEKYWMNI